MGEEGINALLEGMSTLTRLVAKIADEVGSSLLREIEQIKIILMQKRREEIEEERQASKLPSTFEAYLNGRQPRRDGDKYPPPRLKRGNDPTDAP